jgi:hypothetical protein
MSSFIAGFALETAGKVTWEAQARPDRRDMEEVVSTGAVVKNLIPQLAQISVPGQHRCFLSMSHWLESRQSTRRKSGACRISFL